MSEVSFAMLSKEALRLEMRRQLKSVSPLMLQEGAAGLGENLQKILSDFSVRRLFGYMAVGAEPDVTGFMQSWLDSGKILCLPRFRTETGQYEMVAVPDLAGGNIISGKFGILEPADYLPAENYSRSEMPPEENLWLVPGLAFDEKGARLGRGGGYYDRLLQDAPGWKIGIAWDFQILEDVPRMSFDVAMNFIVTPTRIVSCSKLA